MAHLKIRWTKTAAGHLRRALDYIEERSPQGAINVKARVVQAVARLEIRPEMGRPGRIENTRELVIRGTPYIVSYRFVKGPVEILAFVHSSQKWHTGE